ncbi:hypothetical protein ACQ4PT_068624 [Festuca glaucescens]
MDDTRVFPKKTKTKRAEQPEGPCCVSVLDDDTLADIFSRLPTSASVMRVSATCRSWRRVIAARRSILSRHTPALCGVFSSHRFYRAAVIGSPHLAAEMPESGFDVSALPGGPWRVVDCRGGRLLLHRQRTVSSSRRTPFAHDLAVYHLVTRHLATLPPLPRARCSFAGAGLFLDGASATSVPLFKVGCVIRDVSDDKWLLHVQQAGASATSVPLFKVGCVIRDVSDDKWLLHVHARSGGWETLHASVAPGTSTDGIERLCVRASECLFSALRTRRGDVVEEALMFDTRTATFSTVSLRNHHRYMKSPVGTKFINDSAFVDVDGGGDNKVWLACLHDLELRLYSHQRQQASRSAGADAVGWTLEKHAPLREHVWGLIGRIFRKDCEQGEKYCNAPSCSSSYCSAYIQLEYSPLCRHARVEIVRLVRLQGAVTRSCTGETVLAD